MTDRQLKSYSNRLYAVMLTCLTLVAVMQTAAVALLFLGRW